MRVDKCQYFIFLACIFLFLTSEIFCERRIVKGHTTNENATFMVYLLRAETANVTDPAWICGGAIVSRWFVLTAASCLEQAGHVYVVAGYEKYVRPEDVENDECIIKTRKKVTTWCFESHYKLGKLDNGTWTDNVTWARGDIALARVEEPFKFKDPLYLRYCSYLPSKIAVSTTTSLYNPGTPVLTYGWGHRKFLREDGDSKNYNMDRLHYVSMIIMPKEECKSWFTGAKTKSNINDHGICANGTGYIDDEGLIANLMNVPMYDCNNDTLEMNDHGGPLVVWYGGRRYVIGVSGFCGTVNRVKAEECVSPSVFIKIACVELSLMCILSRSRKFNQCEQLRKKLIVERSINWAQLKRTTAPVTTARVTPAPVTTASVTTAHVTTAPVTTARVTTARVTIARIRTARVRTVPVTTETSFETLEQNTPSFTDDYLSTEELFDLFD